MIRELRNGDAMLIPGIVVATRIGPQGWKVRMLDGTAPWPSRRPGAHEGEMTSVRFVTTKAAARRIMQNLI